jgi:hypothetical protein
MSQQERQYVGRGKKAGNFDLVNFSISESKVKESWFEYNGERYLKLTIGALKNPDNYGKTHSVWIDNYKPKEGGNDGGGQAPVKEKLNDLPF